MLYSHFLHTSITIFAKKVKKNTLNNTVSSVKIEELQLEKKYYIQQSGQTNMNLICNVHKPHKHKDYHRATRFRTSSLLSAIHTLLNFTSTYISISITLGVQLLSRNGHGWGGGYSPSPVPFASYSSAIYRLHHMHDMRY